MTNVPNNLREMWSDVYRLFDSNYLMQNSDEAWRSFWLQAVSLYEKYNKPKYLVSMIIVVSELIEERQLAEKGK